MFQMPTAAALSRMTAAELKVVMAELAAEMHDLHQDDEGNVRDIDAAGHRARFDQLLNMHDRARAHLAVREAIEGGSTERAFGAPEVMTRETVWSGEDVYRMTDTQVRSKALKALDLK